MGGRCEACRANINVTQKRIKCTQCSHNYHSECINFNNDTALRSEWKCPACTASCRKGGDNSNTPIRTNKSLSNTVYDKTTYRSSNKSTDQPTCITETSSCQPYNLELINSIELLLDKKLSAIKFDIFQELKLSLITEIKNDITSNLKQLEESYNSLLNDYNNLKSNFEKLQQNVQNGEMKLAELCAQIKKEQQWGRLSNLEIVGLPENSKESTSELIIKIASHAGIKLTDDQIVFAHRVQPMQNVGDSPQLDSSLKNIALQIDIPRITPPLPLNTPPAIDALETTQCVTLKSQSDKPSGRWKVKKDKTKVCGENKKLKKGNKKLKRKYE
ncbi:unnamed protein product [Parnassius apollo]|uniref:(apollo) hypothetical protein n=1 Tax=Parnassius apollo TaxID=110799 RepID=A0A8S3XQB3_PARAO|nr:unnamed protein product [Parnassius apollo]